MPGPSNSSFIPKRNPVKQKRNQPSRRIYIFTIVSYVLLFAALLSAGGTFFYQEYIDAQLQREITDLNNEISSFSEADMQRVLEFDRRVTQAASRIDNSVSIASVLEALEAATIDTVQLQSLNISRVADDSFSLNARVVTDTFDSTIFQRGVYERNQVISDVEIGAVNTSEAQSEADEQGGVRSLVMFDATLEVPLDAVPYVVTDDKPVTFTITNPVDLFDSSTSTATTTDDNNETP
tara:strand:+ start:1340 stop:2050 length:711 start_codon:yes stop_codon:yes gene_type:complete